VMTTDGVEGPFGGGRGGCGSHHDVVLGPELHACL